MPSQEGPSMGLYDWCEMVAWCCRGGLLGLGVCRYPLMNFFDGSTTWPAITSPAAIPHCVPRLLKDSMHHGDHLQRRCLPEAPSFGEQSVSYSSTPHIYVCEWYVV